MYKTSRERDWTIGDISLSNSTTSFMHIKVNSTATITLVSKVGAATI